MIARIKFQKEDLIEAYKEVYQQLQSQKPEPGDENAEEGSQEQLQGDENEASGNSNSEEAKSPSGDSQPVNADDPGPKKKVQVHAAKEQEPSQQEPGDNSPEKLQQ